jgi:putative FmdB family regulatory protein
LPLYEYQCRKCGRFEVIRRFSDRPLKKCPTCGKPVQRLASAPAVHFKGTGWYVTDYAGKGGEKGKKDEARDGDKRDAKADAGATAKADAAAASSDTGAATSKSAAKERTAAKPGGKGTPSK